MVLVYSLRLYRLEFTTQKKAIDQPIFFFVVCFPLAVSVQGFLVGLPSFFGVRILHAGASLNAFGNA